MTKSGNRTTAFRGPVTTFRAFAEQAEQGGVVPAAQAGPVLRLPTDRGALPGAGDGPFATIELRALTESMGTVESALRRCAGALREGGRLIVDCENEQSLRRLRVLLDGHVGSFDPAGSLLDPSQAVSLRRLLQACDTAGLFVHDVARVPTPAAELAAGFATAAFEHGFLPLAWLDGPPPQRFWLACSRRVPLAGSVLVGAGSAADQERTAACVRAFLPAEWEIVLADGDRECDGWNRAIARAHGDLLWFLRAGATVARDLFEELLLGAVVSPAAPGADGQRARPGDVSGLMIARRDVLITGPMADPDNTQVALEEYCMRLDACTPPPTLVDAAFASPAAPIEVPATFAAEAKALLARWSAMSRPRQGAAEVPPPMAAADATPAPWHGRRPRVSLCMIARNEERFLPECLARARAAVDEIVLVDTGSTDRTVAIAESFGARVLHEAWADDFAAPRNTAIAAATGDWILVLDADEFLVDGAAERIRELVEAERVSGYHMRFTNIYTGGKTVGVMMVRLFRNLPGVSYQNVIHEQVTPTLCRVGASMGLELSICEVEVEHHGYADEVMTSRGKNERNERLFKKQLEQHPDDIYSLYKYGDFLRRVPGRAADARRQLDRCLELILDGPPTLPRELPYAGEVAALCALECARLEQVDRAVAIVDEALRRFIPTPNLHYIAASLMLARELPDAAIAHFRRCLGYRGHVLVVPIQDGITGHVSLLGIAQALALRGDLVRSRRLAERAVAMAPAYEVGHMVLSKLHLRLGDAGAALRTLVEFLAEHPESPGACQQTSLILQRLGCVDQARRMGDRAVLLLQRNGAEHEAARMQEILAAM